MTDRREPDDTAPEGDGFDPVPEAVNPYAPDPYAPDPAITGGEIPPAVPGTPYPAADSAPGQPPAGFPTFPGAPYGGPVDREPFGATPLPTTAPSSILTAVRLMYAGAVLQVINGIALFFMAGALVDNQEVRDEVGKASGMSGAELQDMIDQVGGMMKIVAVVLTVVLVALWLWMAQSNKAGKRWARTTSAVLATLGILFAVYGLLSGFNIGMLIMGALAAAILYFLYRPESSAYYEAVGNNSARP